MNIGETLEARQPEDFAAWLAANADQKQEIWLIIYKKASGKQTVTYQQLVEVALCYGWIDSIMKSIDVEKSAQRFSPRRKRSNWTATNKVIARRLIAEGRMTEAGRAALPDDLRQALKSDQLLDP
jgi:uncharacterized protein YdeI (YjbR/CyaY-like superfamily)